MKILQKVLVLGSTVLGLNAAEITIGECLSSMDSNYAQRIYAMVKDVEQPQPSHTKFGEGLRFPYPASESRDSLKAGEEVENYDAKFFEAPVLKECEYGEGKPGAQSWADPEDPTDVLKQIEAGRKRNSKSPYASISGVVIEQDDLGRPINYMGKTGISGRGELGNWGENPAGDPMVVRVEKNLGKLLVLLIKRGDSGEMALPGGMVDPDEDTKTTATAERELKEETTLSLADLKNKNLVATHITPVYEGYVDDPRNTDNAWMVTRATLFALSPEAEAKVTGQDDAAEAKWFDVETVLGEDFKLFASHKPMVEYAIRLALEEYNAFVGI